VDHPCAGLFYRRSVGVPHRWSNYVPNRMGTRHMDLVPMSIIFTPKIPLVFTSRIVAPEIPKPPKIWHKRVIWKFVNLRALAVPIEDCATLVGHSLEECLHAVEELSLTEAISTRRHVLIKDVMR